MFKIGKYSTTYSITAGLGIAILGSLFLYMAYFDLSSRPIESASALLFFWFLLRSDTKTWFWSGFFLSLLWFWWILVSFEQYHMLWAIPLGALFIAMVYGGIFWLIARLDKNISKYMSRQIGALANAPYIKILGLLLLSYLHPLSFDWFKPELLFVHTYLGVDKWQFAVVLFAILLSQYKKNILFLLLVLFAYSPSHTTVTYQNPDSHITLANTMTTVEDKWNPKLVSSHIKEVLQIINQAVAEKKQIVVLPESVFPFFLNNEPKVLEALLERSKQITIIIGALYLDGKTHRNSTYIIQDGHYTIANKVRLVPFGESNPLPQWASHWVNKIFFDGAIDYIASAEPTDFEIAGTSYRNAICYESTSEVLYRDAPKQMIVTSNNGWFIPSIEPVEQRLLLTFYSRKYGTTIYHSVNMSPSYTIQRNQP
jgi:apolipoprotein N-acyltransferase